MDSGQVSTRRRAGLAGRFGLRNVGMNDGLASRSPRPTSTRVGRLALAGEIVFLPLVAIVLGFALSPEDPFWINASFPWAWFAPVILALRYGSLAGIGGAGVLLGAWLLVNVGGYETFPELFFLGGLILVMLCGKSSSLWLSRTRRAETLETYFGQRLDQLTRQHYLLRLSHDRLEQDLISRPISMRDALRALRGLGGEGNGSAGSAQTLLRLLAQYCQLESAALYPVRGLSIDRTALATLGSPSQLREGDPLVRQAIETHKLCHVRHAQEAQQHTHYLIAAPLVTLDGDLHGLLVVDELPFFSLQDETLQTINLLLGYYSDGLAVRTLAEPVRAAVPDCPPEFAFEAQRASHLHQTSGIGSAIVALEFLPHAIEQDLPREILRIMRGLDEHWLFGNQDRQVLATLMPLASVSAAEDFVARIETWARQRSTRPLAELGVFPHIMTLDAEAPAAVVKRLRQLASG